MLILCLLVTFNLISQNDTNKKVTLSESISKKVVKDLEDYDLLKVIESFQKERIKNLESQISLLENKNKSLEKIISLSVEMIENKDKIINNKKPLEFHFYTGGEFINNFSNLNLYFKTQFEFKKVNIGAKLNLNLTKSYRLPQTWYSVYAEFKVF